MVAGCATQSPYSILPPENTPPAYTPGELNGETLQDIVTAELAGHRHDFKQALALYLKQAELTGDLGVIQRAVRIAQFAKDTEGLERAARIWLKHEPDASEPSELLAGLLIHQGQFEAAQPYLANALKSDRRQIQLLVSAQANQLSAQQANAFLPAFKQQLRLAPERADLWLAQGILLRRTNNPAAAIDSFSRALKADPELLEAAVQKADLLKETGQYPAALAMLDDLLASQPDNKQFHIYRIQTLYKAGKSKAALDESKLLIGDNPNETQLHLYLALLALDHNRLSESKQMLEALQLQHPDKTPTFYLGIIAEQENRSDQAISHYLNVNSGPHVVQAYARALGLFKTPDDKARVHTVISEAQQTNAELGPELVNLEADWLRNMGFVADATAQLDKGIQQYPDNLNLRYTRAMLRPAEEFPLAESEFRYILKQEPDNALALNALGYTLSLYTDRYEEAYSLLQRALALKPNDAAIIDSMGWVLFKLKRYDESLEHLSRAYALFQDPEVGGHLITVLAVKGQRQKAQTLLSELLQRFPDNPHLLDAEKVLNQQP